MLGYRWKEQDAYVEWMEDHCGIEAMHKLRDSEAKLQQQLQESVKRENVLNMKLATKHQEMQDLLVSNDKCMCRLRVLPLDIIVLVRNVHK